jgi:glucose repression regulatory protein TUP1
VLLRFTMRRREPGLGALAHANFKRRRLTHATSVLIDDKANKYGDLYIRSVCFSPDGKYLATGAEDRQIRVSSPPCSSF